MQQNALKKVPAFPVLQFIDDIFEPFLQQSRNIVIRCQLDERDRKKPAQYIVSVNDCSTTEVFMSMLTSIIASSFELLHESFQSPDSFSLFPVIEYLIEIFEELKLIVTDETFIFREKNSKVSQQVIFKSFTDYRIDAPDDFDFIMNGHWILYQTRKFAEVWLQVISFAIRRAKFVNNLQQQPLKTRSLPLPELPESIRNFTIKFNLSVSQLAFFLKILDGTKILDLPPRNISKLVRWAIRNIRSKYQELISFTSLRTKFDSPEPSDIEFWKKTLSDCQKWIDDYCENHP